MRVGVHLPQYGRVAGPGAIRTAAQRAEELGFADIWVSDHIVQPVGQDYPSPYLYDPLLTLAWGAAATERIGLGTSVIVAPQHNPLWLANALASLDALSGGRVIAGLGVGWSEGEFDALGYPFHDRGRRTDEIVDVLRACWHNDPVSFSGRFYSFGELRLLPKPAHEIPVWIGGRAEAAYARGVAKGDGFQLLGLTPAEAAPLVARLRRDRPDPGFTVSLRTGWDPQGMDHARIRDELIGFTEAGIQHVVSAPWRREPGEWIRSMELLAELVLE